MRKMKALLSMYSLRDEMAADLDKTLESAAQMGFDGIELAWYAGHTPEEVLRAVKRIGLDVWSCHTDVREMLADPKKIFDDISAFGARYVIICHMRPEERPDGADYEQTLEDVARLSEMAHTEYGLKMLYHNHGFDMNILQDGRRSLDVTYDTFAIDGGELDTCWVDICGESSAEYLKRYAGRIPLMHIKDFRRIAPAGRFTMAPEGTIAPAPGCEFCPLGWGEIDFKKVFDTAEETGVQALILEAEEPGCVNTLRENVEISAKEMFRLLGR